MAKYFGKVGFAVTGETRPGVWEETFVEREYYGDLIRNVAKNESGAKVNDDVNISNNISIIADPFACENFHTMKYVEYMNAKWKVTSVEVQYPRLVLTVGGLFNEQE